MEVITKSVFLILTCASIAGAQIVGPSSNASDGSKVSKAGDTMTGPLTLNGSSLTVTGAGRFGDEVKMLKAGGGSVIVGRSDAAAGGGALYFQGYSGETPYYNTAIVGATSSGLFFQTDPSNDTSDNLTSRMGISPTGSVNINNDLTVQSTMTVQGSSFSVGTSTLVVSNGRVGVGATSSTSKFLVSSPDAGTSWDSAEPLVTISNLDQNSGQAWGLLVRGGANGASTKIMEAQTYAADSAFTIQGNGLMYGYSRTLAQIDAITPGAAGGMVTCSNCSAPYTICMSTGTGRGAFVNLNTTNHCN